MRFREFDPAWLARRRQQQIEFLEKKKQGLYRAIPNSRRSNSVALRNKTVKVTLPKIGK
jgi:hypothetical protein